MATAKIKTCPDCDFPPGQHEATCVYAARIWTLTQREDAIWNIRFATTGSCLEADRRVRQIRAHFANPNHPSLLKDPNPKDPNA